jgi:multisubunit Na+/H+ antiporter MnhF subunit
VVDCGVAPTALGVDAFFGGTCMDLNKLTRGDQVIGISGIVLFIFSFFSWLGAKVNVSGRVVPGLGSADLGSKSAWGWTLTLFAVLIGIALVAYVVLKAAGVEIPDKFGSVTLAQIVLGLAAIAFLFVVIKLIAGPNIPTTSIGGVTVSKTRKLGIFVGLLATAGLVAGAFLNFQESQKGSPAG